jgi:Tfp pilus assembly protein PilX
MTLSRTPRHPADEGFALMTVLIGMLALTVVLIATLGYVANSLPVSKRGQDAAGALQAAQAGIDDFLARIATCDSYWQDGRNSSGTYVAGASSPCRRTSVNPALSVGTPGADTAASATGWAVLPLSTAVTPSQYHVDEVASPATGVDVVTVRSTGRVVVSGKRVKRTLEVNLTKPRILDYIYYTDKESSDPALVMRRFPPRVTASGDGDYPRATYSGVSATEAAKCDRYWYAAGGTAGRSDAPTESLTWSRSDGSSPQSRPASSYSCDIQFSSIDTIDGSLHTNDAILLDGPLFKGETTSAWPAGASPAPTSGAWYRVAPGGSGPSSAGTTPKYRAPITLPDSNAALKSATDPATGGLDGCLYSGPTRIVLKSNGTMDVTSPYTTSTNAGCTTGSPTAPGLSLTQNVPLPGNGVVYVDRTTAGCSGKPTGTYPLSSSDVTSYDCASGDVFLEGTLKGQLTIASKNDIVVTGNVTYASGSTGSDVLGLVAEGDVEVYHPVSCSSPAPAGYTCTSFTNLPTTLSSVTINAAILSVKHSFTVQNYDRGAKLGTLTVAGGIYQAFRGPVGTSGGGGGTGYAKAYSYDTRLKALPPPSFLNPVSSSWLAQSYAEIKVPYGLPS